MGRAPVCPHLITSAVELSASDTDLCALGLEEAAEPHRGARRSSANSDVGREGEKRGIPPASSPPLSLGGTGGTGDIMIVAHLPQ